VGAACLRLWRALPPGGVLVCGTQAPLAPLRAANARRTAARWAVRAATENRHLAVSARTCSLVRFARAKGWLLTRLHLSFAGFECGWVASGGLALCWADVCVGLLGLRARGQGGRAGRQLWADSDEAALQRASDAAAAGVAFLAAKP
jgi:hypothetical protein